MAALLPSTYGDAQHGPVDMTKILIVDDHPMFREALRGAVKSARPEVEVFEVGGIEAARDMLRSEPGIEIVLLDLSLPGTSGFDGLILLRSCFPRIPIPSC